MLVFGSVGLHRASRVSCGMTGIEPHPEHANLVVVSHPLVQVKLTEARDQGTPHWRFCALVREISGLMLYECTRDWPTVPREIETPLEQMTGIGAGPPIALVPILRAGLGMTSGMVDLMPDARVGHIGLARDENSLEPIEYYQRLPEIARTGWVLMLDPMLATGGSAVAAANVLKQNGCTNVRMVCLVAAPEGVRVMREAHPDIMVFAAALDRGLNDSGFILPGLGDAGDRIFGTYE